MNSTEDKAQAFLREFDYYKGRRLNWESHWQEISERIWPSHYPLFQSGGSPVSRGEKRNQFVFDSTASLALNRFASILDSLLTPRNQTWHRLTPSDKNLMKDRDTRLWFDEVNEILFKYRYAPKANFSSQNQLNYKSLGAYGTGCMFTDALAGEPGLRYKSVFLGEIYFGENHQGIIDKAYRYFTLTARQAFQKWGENVPEDIKSCLKTNPEKECWFVHVVKPREDRDPERVDYKGMEYGSWYVSVAGKKILEEGGFRTFPYAISRYEQVPNEVYGRGPAMDALPAIKVLNEQKKTNLKQGHRAVDPIFLAHDDGVIDAINGKPGSVIWGGVDANGRPLVHTLPTGNYEIGKDLMEQERQTINDIFLVTLFQILVESPQMTATEVMERAKEKGMLVAPTMGRQQSEYLGPKIEREVDVLESQGLIPPMPPALEEAQGEFKIVYDSPLSRAQRAEEAAGLMRSIETALMIVNASQNPAPLDHFNWDMIIPEIGEIQGLPARWMRSLDEVEEIRQGRAEEAEAAAAAQAAPGAAALMNAGTKAAEV